MATPKRIYIAGPMTGLPGLNFAAFHAEASRLRRRGYTVINPAEINPDETMAWAECMRRDIAALVTCDAIRLLPGWEQSKGAALERYIAERLELSIYYPGDKLAPRPLGSIAPLPPAACQFVRNSAHKDIASAGTRC